MFTGIILAVGSVAAIEQKSGDCRLQFNVADLPIADAGLGDSIAVNGVCLTAVELGDGYFIADVSNETLSKSTLKDAVIGMPVNLELALKPSSRMGGHMVSGHVDGIATVLEKKADARSVRFRLQAPDNLARYIAEKGSICIDGISLTVNEVDAAIFGVNVVPHTLIATTLGNTEVGHQVNLEVDLLARYLERLLSAGNSQGKRSGITEELLNNYGFLK